MRSSAVWKYCVGVRRLPPRATALNRSASLVCFLRPAGALALLAFSLPLIGIAAPTQQLSGGHVPAAVKRLKPVGNLPGKQRLNLAIGLPLRNQQELEVLLRELYDPASPNYRHYLTPEQFTQRFGPTEQDYKALMEFTRSNGFTVTATHPNRLVLDVSSTVGEIERTFHTVLRVYKHPTEARTFYAPEVAPSIAFAIPILHISGLDDYALPHPGFKAKPGSSVTNPAPNFGTGPGSSYRGNDFRRAYIPGTTLTGAGQSVGLLQFDGFYASDVATYATQAGLPTVPSITVVPVNGGISSPGTNNSEVSMDIELAISMAPGLSRVYVYEAPFNTANFVDLLSRMANDNLAKQLSCSWAWMGGAPNSSAENIFKQMAAQGQSFFTASGDYDAWIGAIGFPSDSTNITVVGGTELITGSDGSYISESVWNRGNGHGSGGGVSTSYSIPSYQQGVSMAANHGSTIMRNVPDVALIAENIYVVYGNGSNMVCGGTSCAAPLWAAFTALVNEQAAAAGQAPIGFLNPALYAIGIGTNYTLAFHDITSGNNYWSGSPNNYPAVVGYDLCTGWGTPNGTNLVNLLTFGAPSGSAPWITGQPQSQTVNPGASASFTVQARGTPPLDYQWFFDGQPITGATGFGFSIPRVQSIQAGTYTVLVTNSYGSVLSAPATLTVSSATAFGIIGVPFRYLIPATNNPTWYSASDLPPGLHLDTTSGLIYGVPTQTGRFAVIVAAGNILGSVWSATIRFTIADGEITSATNVVCVLGAPFSYQITADNLPTWYSASVPPPGMYFDPTSGLIFGAPSQTGTFWVGVGAKNTLGEASALVRFVVVDGAITSPTSVVGVIGTPFSYQITANNNPSSYSASGPPPGLFFDPLGGVIAGIPTQIGTFWVTVGAKNMFGSASALVSFTIAGVPSTTSLLSSLNPANYGQAIIFTATVTGRRQMPTGAVTFYDGASVIGAAALNGSGVAVLPINRLSATGSPHSITAVYNGDSLYAPSTSPAVSQVIYPALLSATAIIAPKVYDGSTNAPVAAVHLAGILTGDEPDVWAASTNAFYADNKNVGTGKPVWVAITLGGSLAGNYTNRPFSSSGAVTARPIIVTAVTDTKNYDGNSTSAGVPTLTGTLAAGDSIMMLQTFDSPNAGPRTLTPVVSITDGNRGANYNVTRLTAPGYINPVCSTVNRLLWITNNGNSTVTLGLQGTFQAQYYVMATTNPAALTSTWLPLAGSTNIVTNASGLWNLTVPASGPQNFYLPVANQICP